MATSVSDLPDATEMLRGEDIIDRVLLTSEYLSAFDMAVADALADGSATAEQLDGKMRSAVLAPKGDLFLFTWLDQAAGLVFGILVPTGQWAYDQ